MDFLDLKEIFITFETTSNGSSNEYIQALEKCEDLDELTETIAMWKKETQDSIEVAHKYLNSITE